MEMKHLIIVGVILLIIVSLVWMASLLPGLGFGLGGGKGQGNGTGMSAEQDTAPKPGEEEDVVVSAGAAIHQKSKQNVTPEQVAEWAKGGRKFVIRDAGDAERKVMEDFRDVARASEGRIVVKE